jgi:hypothetical protein
MEYMRNVKMMIYIFLRKNSYNIKLKNEQTF